MKNLKIFDVRYMADGSENEKMPYYLKQQSISQMSMLVKQVDDLNVLQLGLLNLQVFSNQTGIGVVDKLIPDRHPNNPNRELKNLKAIVVHYTANPHPSADAINNAKYFGRSYSVRDSKYVESNGANFRFGSAQIIFDCNRGCRALPLDSIAWGSGDTPIQPDGKPGQRPLAINILNGMSNSHSLHIEICNNNNWLQATKNAHVFIQWVVNSLHLNVLKNESLNPQVFKDSLSPNEILVLRHHDVTGKICPKPFIDDPLAWQNFVMSI